MAGQLQDAAGSVQSASQGPLPAPLAAVGTSQQVAERTPEPDRARLDPPPAQEAARRVPEPEPDWARLGPPSATEAAWRAPEPGGVKDTSGALALYEQTVPADLPTPLGPPSAMEAARRDPYSWCL